MPKVDIYIALLEEGEQSAGKNWVVCVVQAMVMCKEKKVLTVYANGDQK